MMNEYSPYPNIDEDMMQKNKNHRWFHFSQPGGVAASMAGFGPADRSSNLLRATTF